MRYLITGFSLSCKPILSIGGQGMIVVSDLKYNHLQLIITCDIPLSSESRGSGFGMFMDLIGTDKCEDS